MYSNKIRKLVLLSKRLEDKLPPTGKLKLAKKRLMKVANIDESEIEKIKKQTLDKKLSDMKEKVITNFGLMQDIKVKSEEDPENESLREELERKDSDLRFSVEDLVRAEREARGEDPNEPTPLSAKTSEDKTDSSSEQLDDDSIEEIIEDISEEDEDRFVE